MKLFLVLYYLCATITAFNQKIETIHLSKYSQKDGLPSYNVRKVIQDSKGFIWAGTQDGVSRFDGKTFLNYSKSSSKKNKICGVDVREMIEDTAANLLWILPGEVGINAINTQTGDVVVTAPIPGLSTEDWIISMIKDENILWIGTSTGINAYNIDKRNFESSLPLPRQPISSADFETRSIIKDEYGNIWGCYSGFGIVIYNDKTKKIIATIPLSMLNDHQSSGDIRFFGYTKVESGDILFATSQGLRRISYSPGYTFKINNSPCVSFPSFNTGEIHFVTINTQKEIFISGNDKFCRFNQDLTNYIILEEPAKTSEIDWLNAVQNIYYDKEGNTWLGCQEGLAFTSKYPSPLKSYNYDKLTNTKLDHLRSIYVFDNGDILAGLRNGIVSINRVNEKYSKSDTGHLYHHVFQDKKGLIHIARPDGMFIYDKGTLISIEKIYPEFSLFKSLPINSHLFANDTTIILGTESANGILVWNPQKKEVRKIEQGTTKNNISSSIVNNIYKDSQNRLWVLSDNVISILSPDMSNNKELVLFEKGTNIPYKLFFDMCEANGSYWITSYGSGLLQLDANFTIKNVFNAEKELCNNGTYQVYNIDNKKLLVTSDQGFSVIDLKTLKIKSYYERNGLHSNSFEEVAGMMKNKKIYAGGPKGFTVIDPALFSVNTSPPVLYFSNIQIKTKSILIDTTNFLMKSIRIPKNVLQTTIYFSALNYENPERTTIFYKIKEQHSDWINIGNKNSLPLIGLGPGTYTLQVKAINEDGIESEIKVLTLIFLPKWYQTLWFKALLGLAIAGVFYSLYRMRINQLKKEQQIRTKLASDLHDDLGSTMNSVKVYANLAIMEKQEDKYLYKIKESTQEAITGIRDIIWVLDDSKDSIEDLFSRVGLFAAPLCEANKMEYKLEVTDDARDHKLGQEEKRNLYMMIKEAVNNAIKYSGGQKIGIEVTVKKGNPEIRITDDGKGFDTENAAEGNGLKNMKRRGKEIKYHVAIESKPGSGTSILFQKI